MTVYIGVLGDSGTGKTTLIEQIISNLSAKGFKVGAVKHSSHDIFDLEGKDTRRFRNAGADVVVGISEEETMIVKKAANPRNIEAIEEILGSDVDVVFMEGLRAFVGKEDRILKIVIINSPDTLPRLLSDLKGRIVVVMRAAWKSKPNYKIKDLTILSVSEIDRLLHMVEGLIEKDRLMNLSSLSSK